MKKPRFLLVICLVLLSMARCGDTDIQRVCDTNAYAQPSRSRIRCAPEFKAQAARPMDASLPGAWTIKTIVDQTHADTPYFLDTNTYPMHRDFAVKYLNYPPTAPFVNEYYYPQRRFLLGSITYYETPNVWAYELAPYDTASADMITRAFRQLARASYFGMQLRFHPTSDAQVARIYELPKDIPVITTEDLFANIDYQPLNLGETVAQVRVLTAAELNNTYVSPRELVVLDRVPNDISTVAGVVTQEFQTPLSHVNVLSQQRGTPNMALRNALSVFAPYDGQYVRLKVSAFAYELREATREEADAWFEAHRPPPVPVPPLNLSVTDFVDVDEIGYGDVGFAGGKACGFGELRNIGGDVIVRPGFVIPMYEYRRFLQETGIESEIYAMLEDPLFRADGNVRRQRLSELRDRIRTTPVNSELVMRIETEITTRFPGLPVRFRSSTNAEDLDGYTGAGLYTSTGVELGNPERTIERGLRKVWASLWNQRAFEEREYMQMPHMDVGMAILVHPSYKNENANGVAITANIFDPAPGGEDAFFVNAQLGEVSVVLPDPSILPDSLIYYYFHNGQPATYLTHSTLLEPGQTVLKRVELFYLGKALKAIRDHFQRYYRPPQGYGALPMDVEWKLVTTPDGTGTRIEIKQARPYPGRGGK